jgi:hypothetical protein
MYGIVNKAIQDLVITNFGTSIWEKVKITSGVDIEYFLSNEPYDDDITFKLAAAVAIEMKISVGDVLIAFGEWWILKTTKEKYGSMLQAGGENLRAFLVNLPTFHNRIMLMYPKLTPPEFKVSHLETTSLYVHYFSKRQGLQEFVRGLLQGLGKLYETPVEILLIQSRTEGSEGEIFKVSWL